MARIVLSFAVVVQYFLFAQGLPSTGVSDAVSVTAAALDTCETISREISAQSDVIYALNLRFGPDTHHYFDTSDQVPACVLEVGSAQDASTAIKILGQTKTPFAIMSGGHASNPGFSSTTGVHISLEKMEQVILSDDKTTVEIGLGQNWASVYDSLEGSGVNVVGGRVPGPGVGGFTLGGGFSWKTNQYGLTVDNVKSLQLILPNGTITTVSSSTPDLFFALKGGLNRFGLVTSAEYYTHPQVPQVYGGFAIYDPTQLSQVLSATAEFFNDNTDPKAQIITTMSGTVAGSSALVLFFYDGPTRPASFSPFDGIPATLSTVTTQTFSSFVNGIPSTIVTLTNFRGTFNTMSTSKLTDNFLNAVKNQSDYWGAQMLLHPATMVSYDVEPFLTNYGQYSTDTAYPHTDSPLPLNLFFAWASPTDDAFWYAAMRESVAVLMQEASNEGILPSDFTQYPNYAITGTSAQSLYGSNAARLSAIRSQVDPGNVMELAGGFAI